MMDWSGMMKKYGWEVDVVGREPFSPLAAGAAAAKAKGAAVARVGVTVGTSSEYGACRASFTVTVDCPQDEANINLAAEAVFVKASELVNDAASHLELPTLAVKA